MGRQPFSGYCQTCRKRRVKCDKQVPECRRCRASGHQCGGYELPLRMQVMGVRWERDGTQRMAPLQVRPPEPSPGLPLTAFRDDIAGAYFFETFSLAPFWRSHLRSAISSAPASPVPRIRNLNKACFQAITITHTGRHHGDVAMQIEGHQIYSRVLADTQAILSRPFLHKAQLAWLIETIILMGMYEFAINQATGSGPHHSGIAHILTRCGPEAFQEGPLLDLFRTCRNLLICQDLCRQRECFIQQDAWKTIPWEYSPKTFEDRLMDVMVHVPGITEDLALTSEGRDEGRRRASKAKILSYLATLRQWRREWNAMHAHSVRIVSVDGDDDVLPTRLEFSSSAQAVEILYYNEALLFLTKLGAVMSGETTSSFALRMADASRGERLSFVPPDYAEPRLQPALESLMALNCATKLLTSSDEKRTVMTPAPLAAVYITLMEEPETAGKWERIMAKYFAFKDAEVMFAGYIAGIVNSWS